MQNREAWDDVSTDPYAEPLGRVTLWHNLRRLIGFAVIHLGWRIYPHCHERAMLTRSLADWADVIARDGK